jgi:hypothetical protein
MAQWSRLCGTLRIRVAVNAHLPSGAAGISATWRSDDRRRADPAGSSTKQGVAFARRLRDVNGMGAELM